MIIKQLLPSACLFKSDLFTSWCAHVLLGSRFSLLKLFSDCLCQSQGQSGLSSISLLVQWHMWLVDWQICDQIYHHWNHFKAFTTVSIEYNLHIKLWIRVTWCKINLCKIFDGFSVILLCLSLPHPVAWISVQSRLRQVMLHGGCGWSRMMQSLISRLGLCRHCSGVQAISS